MTNQRTQDFIMRRQTYGVNGRQVNREVQAQQQKQQQLEKQANEKLAQLAHQQQQQRQLHPASDPQQAALQLQKDEQQLTQLAVKNYREVFLPGQIANALQVERLTQDEQYQFNTIKYKLLDKAWWKSQEPAQLATAVKAYGDTLTMLTGGVLGIDLTSPPVLPNPFSTSRLDAQLANDVFDKTAAMQLFQEAELTAKLIAGERLIKVITELRRLSAVPTSPEGQSDYNKRRQELRECLHLIDDALERYYAKISSSTTINNAKKALMKSTEAYANKKV